MGRIERVEFRLRGWGWVGGWGGGGRVSVRLRKSGKMDFFFPGTCQKYGKTEYLISGIWQKYGRMAEVWQRYGRGVAE